VQHKAPRLLGHGEDTSQQSHIVLPDIKSFPQGFHNTPARKILQPVTEHQKMGKFAGQRRSLAMRMKKSVHAERGDFIEMGSTGGLKRGPVVKQGVASIAKAVEK